MSYELGDIATFNLMGTRRDCVVLAATGDTLALLMPWGITWQVAADSPNLAPWDGRPCAAVVERDIRLRQARAMAAFKVDGLSGELADLRGRRNRAFAKLALSGEGFPVPTAATRRRLERFIEGSYFREADMERAIREASAELARVERRLYETGSRPHKGRKAQED